MQITNKPQKLTEKNAGTVLEQKTGRFLRSVSSLRHRNFRLFWSGQLISLIGTWMQTTGQAWLVLQLTHSAWWLGVVGALQFLPIMLFSLFGGVLADRLPKRRVLLFTQTFAGLQAITLWTLVFTGTVQLWHVFVLALLLGTTNALDMPTRQSFVVEMVGREDLTNAIALNSSIFNMARVLGPGIAGIVIARLGEAPLFLLNSLSFIPVIIGLAMIDLSRLHNQPRAILKHATGHTTFQDTFKGTFHSLGEGLNYTFKMPAVFLTIMVVGTISLFGINFNVVLPLFADNVLKVGAQGFGFISAAFGIGSLLSALWLAWGNRKPGINQIIIAGFFFSIFEALFALSHLYILSLFLIATVGFAQVAFSAVANTTLQTVTPNHLRGRVMSVYMLIFAGTTPIGNLFIGGIAHLASTPIALLAGALLSLLAAIIGWLFRKPAQKSIAQQAQLELALSQTPA